MPVIIASIIFPTSESVHLSKDIRLHIVLLIDLWGQGLFETLVENTVTTRRGVGGLPGHGGYVEACEESSVRAYNYTLQSGQIRKLARRSTSR